MLNLAIELAAVGNLRQSVQPRLPFDDCFFSVVAMLAVAEHLNPASLVLLFSEVYRVLQPGGMVILTTPASWSDGLLRCLARFGLVSREEIEEYLEWCFYKNNANNAHVSSARG